MNIDERVSKVEKRVDPGEDRTKLIEQAIIQMRDLVISHDERMEDYFRALRESREDFNFKLNAVIAAQLENEAGIRELRESTKELQETTKELRESTKELRDASRSQLTRIENLENN